MQSVRSRSPNTYDAMDTNLSAFRRHGGKLIIWQGWADQAIPTYGTVDYYDTLATRMGGQSATQKFARMFLFPVYPYPLVPKYNGSGSTSDAANFHPVVSPHANDYSDWIGNYLFYQPVGSSGFSGHSRSHKA